MNINNILNILFENEVLEDDININAIGLIGLDLAEPLMVVEDQARRNVPRNENYYENVISNYMGDLFVQHFRMTRNTFEELLHVIRNTRIIPQTVIPFEKKLLFGIWILAKPESFLAAGDRFGFARSTAHKIFRDIVVILENMIPQFIVWPNNHQGSINEFRARSRGFPGVVGAIDGSHIPIKQPPFNANDYFNRKEFHSIILQGICDHRMVFIDIFVGMPGRVHDARVFRRSDIFEKLTDVDNPLLNQNLHLLGDSAYPIMKNLLTPFRDNGHLNDMQKTFNFKLSGIRSIIERAFGRLKGKFRRLKYMDIGNPDFGTQMIGAACVLHNFIIVHGNEEDVICEADNLENAVYGDFEDDRNVGQEKRMNIANLLFNVNANRGIQ